MSSTVAREQRADLSLWILASAIHLATQRNSAVTLSESWRPIAVETVKNGFSCQNHSSMFFICLHQCFLGLGLGLGYLYRNKTVPIISNTRSSRIASLTISVKTWRWKEERDPKTLRNKKKGGTMTSKLSQIRK